MSAKITKAVVAALVLAGTALVSDASAAKYRGGWYQGQDAYMAICRSRFCS